MKTFLFYYFIYKKMGENYLKIIKFAIEDGYKPDSLKHCHKNNIKENIKIEENIIVEGYSYPSKGFNYENRFNGVYLVDEYYNVFYPLEKEFLSKSFLEALTSGLSKLYYGKVIDYKDFLGKNIYYFGEIKENEIDNVLLCDLEDFLVECIYESNLSKFVNHIAQFI